MLVEDCLCLDIAALKKAGYLDHKGAAEFSFSWTWPDGWVAKAALKVITAGDKYGPRLYLKMSERPAIQEQMICLDQTKPNYGGIRWWFKCECGERCSKLYLRRREHEFRCRKALDLTYESQNLGPVWRLQRKAWKQRRKLEADQKSVELDNKPKGMWTRTFMRLSLAARKAEERALPAMQGWLAHHLGR
jgi:hypothetical protein